MQRRTYLSVVGLTACGTVGGCLGTDSESSGDGVSVETITEALSHPWGMAFLPEDPQIVVTERDSGRVVLTDRETGGSEAVDGVPNVSAAGQGGLLDVTLHPEFPDEPWLYLTYSAANTEGETTTHLGRGRLDVSTASLTEFELLHAADPFLDRANHYGSRVVFGPDGLLYMTVGDRQFKDFGPDHVAQETTNDLGSTLRFRPDGSIPADNPFVADPEARDEIYSYGHRNPQGMTVHPETGEIWQSEHGERDGDELNRLQQGGNYGWPVASEACRYGTDQPVGEAHANREDVVDPVYYWECGSGGFPPSGMTFYDGAYSNWQGDLFVGNLADQYLGRFSVDGTTVEEREPLVADRGWRIREVSTDPATGELYALVDADPAPLVRLSPA